MDRMGSSGNCRAASSGGAGSGQGLASDRSGGAGDDSGGEEPDSSSLSTLSPEQPQSQQQALEGDLEQFRQEWRQDLCRSSTNPAQTTPGEQKTTTTEATSKTDKAVELYVAAMKLEQRGQLYEATQKYRRAVQLEPTVDEAVRRLLVSRQRQLAVQPDGNGNLDQAPPQEGEKEEPDAADGADVAADEGEDEEPEAVLARLQQMTLEDGRCCQPAVPQTDVHISCLPTEVIQLILRWVVSADLDMRSLDRLSLVCRGLYRLCRDPALWKRICRRVLGAGCAEAGLQTPWRELYLSRPHLHFPGCYVGRASYIRSGENNGYQDSSYRPWHIVHYQRYLRFFPDGVVLMLTSADEPVLSMPQLIRRPPRSGPTISGNFWIKGDLLVAVLMLPRDNGRRKATRARRRENLQYDPGESMMHMELKMLPFRLKWQSYRIITRYTNGRETINTMDLGDQFPPLVFCPVRSYAAVSEAPLC